MTDFQRYLRRALAAVLIVAIAGLIVFGVSRIANLLVLLFTAWVLAVTLEVPVRWLQRWKIPRTAAVLISILLVLLIGGAFIALVIPPFIEQADALISGLPDTILSATHNYVDLRRGSDLAARLLPPLNVKDVEAVLQGDLTLVLPLFEGGQNAPPIDIGGLAGNALPVLREIGSFIASSLANLFLIALLALLLLLDPVSFYRAIISMVPRHSEDRALDILNMVRHNITTWLGAMLLSMGVTTILFLIVLGLILNLPNALALSLLAGLATFVPTFGPTVALIPIAVIAAAAGWQKLILTVILYASVGLVQDRVITPAIMKSELDIPPAALVFSQLALAAIIGPLGLLLAVPILAILITLVRELYVFDSLGKRENVTDIVETHSGDLALVEQIEEIVEETAEAELQDEEPEPETAPAEKVPSPFWLYITHKWRER